ncbi:UNVERIFIED_CONTAM: hypothetical protein FKN15_049302 [Acipenser sinensis]
MLMQKQLSVRDDCRPITALGYHPTQREALTGCTDGVIKWWDIESGRRTASSTKEHSGMITHFLYWADSKLLLSASNDGTVVVWTIGATVLEKILLGRPVFSMAISHRQHQLVCGFAGRVTVYPLDEKKGIRTAKSSSDHRHSDIVSCIVCHDSQVYTAGYDRKLIIFDTSSYPNVKGLTAVHCISRAHEAGITALALVKEKESTRHEKAYSPVQWPRRWDFAKMGKVQLLPLPLEISGGWDRRLCIWDLETGELQDTFCNPDLNGWHELKEVACDGVILDLAYSPKRNEFAYSSSDGLIYIRQFSPLGWELRLVSVLQGHQADITAIVWHHLSDKWISGSEDDTIRIWTSLHEQHMRYPFLLCSPAFTSSTRDILFCIAAQPSRAAHEISCSALQASLHKQHKRYPVLHCRPAFTCSTRDILFYIADQPSRAAQEISCSTLQTSLHVQHKRYPVLHCRPAFTCSTRDILFYIADQPSRAAQEISCSTLQTSLHVQHKRYPVLHCRPAFTCSTRDILFYIADQPSRAAQEISCSTLQTSLHVQHKRYPVLHCRPAFTCSTRDILFYIADQPSRAAQEISCSTLQTSLHVQHKRYPVLHCRPAFTCSTRDILFYIADQPSRAAQEISCSALQPSLHEQHNRYPFLLCSPAFTSSTRDILFCIADQPSRAAQEISCSALQASLYKQHKRYPVLHCRPAFTSSTRDILFCIADQPSRAAHEISCSALQASIHEPHKRYPVLHCSPAFTSSTRDILISLHEQHKRYPVLHCSPAFTSSTRDILFCILAQPF